MESFSTALLAEIVSNLTNNYEDNFDKVQCGHIKIKSAETFLEKIFDSRLPINKMPVNPHFLPPIHHRFALKHLIYPRLFYQKMVESLDGISFLYNKLNDEASRELLIKLIAYRILGFKKVKLPRNNLTYWKDIEKARSYSQSNNVLQAKHYTLPLFDLDELGYQVKLNATAEGIAATYIQKQYAYHGRNFECMVEKGDIVIDAGACWGDTTLYFAHEVGAFGKVYAFEFIPANMSIFQHNINQNPHLLERIQIIEQPIWNVSNKELYCFDHGPGSSIAEKLTGQTEYQVCKTISIDDLVERNSLDRIDFIKMDIEGAELNALRGAEKTLKRFRPKLAISVYHKPDDLMTIPKYLDALNLGYQLYLEHHTIHGLETVLFAVEGK